MKKTLLSLLALWAAAAWTASPARAVTDETLEMKAAARQDAQDKAAVQDHNTIKEAGPDANQPAPDQGTSAQVEQAGAAGQPPSTFDVMLHKRVEEVLAYERYRPVVQAADDLAELAVTHTDGLYQRDVDDILHQRLAPALKKAASDGGLEGGNALRGYQVVEEAAKFDCALSQRDGGSVLGDPPMLYYESACVAAYAQRLRLSTPPSVRAALKSEAEAQTK